MPDRFFEHFSRLLVSALLVLPFGAHAQSDNWYRVELLVFSYPAGGNAEQWDATPALAYPEVAQFLSAPGQQPVATSQEPTSLPLTPVDAGATVPNASPGDMSQPIPYITLPTTQREFRGKAAQMQASGRYRILFHEAWTQPISSQSRAQPVVLDRSGDGGPWPALQGSITLYSSRYLYLETNLWLNTDGEYLQSSWRMPAPPLALASFEVEAPAQPAPAIPVTEQLQDSQSQAEPLQEKDALANQEVTGPLYPYRHAVLLKQNRRVHSGKINYIDHPMLGVVIKVTPLGPTGARDPSAI